MNSVEKIASNAAENPVQSTTRTKISQTWLASQTGPIAQSISSRARRPRSPRAGDQAPEPGAEVRAAEHGVRRHAGPQHRGDGVGAAHRGVLGEHAGGAGRAVGHLGVLLVGGAPAARHRPQGHDERGAQHRVEQHDDA